MNVTLSVSASDRIHVSFRPDLREDGVVFVDLADVSFLLHPVQAGELRDALATALGPSCEGPGPR